MNTSSFRKPLAALCCALGLTILGTGIAQAVVITTGCANTNVSCTLDELSNGAAIAIGDKLFSDWIVDFQTNAAVDPNLALIEVVALDDQPMNPGLRFNANGQLSISGTDFIDFIIGYFVDVTSGPLRIKDNTLNIDGYTFGTGTGGFIEIFEDVFCGCSPILIGEKSVYADRLLDEFKLSDSAVFDPLPSIFVGTTLTVEGDLVDDQVALDVFTQRFSQIPEPATGALLALGLAGLGFFARRRKLR